MASNAPLCDFLRARRSSLSPADLGIVGTPGARRVPGLRREEVAQLAAISTDYYTRLEQGRILPSPPVLESLARVLRLDADQTAYLAEIGGLAPVRPKPAPEPDPVARRQLAHLQTIMDDLGSSPAFAIGPRTEILAWNALGAALITDFGAIPLQQRYYVRLLVVDPRMRRLYADWADVTRLSVEQMRRLNATSPDDPELVRLVRELSAIDSQFQQWWASHEVAPRTTGTKLLRHPVVGELHLEWSALTWNSDPGVQLIVWTAAPDSPSHERLLRLRAGVPSPTGR